MLGFPIAKTPLGAARLVALAYPHWCTFGVFILNGGVGALRRFLSKEQRGDSTVSPVFSPCQEELVCPTAPRVRPHSARLCDWTAAEENAGSSNPSSTTARAQRHAVLAEPPRPCAKGAWTGLGRVLQARRCLSYRRLQGHRGGAGPGRLGGVPGGQGRGCAGVEDTMLTVR